MDVASYPRVQNKRIATFRAASRSKARGRPRLRVGAGAQSDEACSDFRIDHCINRLTAYRNHHSHLCSDHYIKDER